MDSASREEDEFVVEGETLGMPSKVYVRPDEIGDLIGVFLSWNAIAYFLRWPFLYARWYLEREDFDEQLRSFGLILSMSLVGVLLVGGQSYLLAHPLQSLGMLLSFAGFSLAASLITARRSLLYAAIMLAEIAYHLLLYRWRISATSFAAWSLIALALLGILGRVVERRGGAPEAEAPEAETPKESSPYARALYRNGYILASLYVAVLAWSFSAHWTSGGMFGAWRMYVPLIGFAVYFLWRFSATRRLAQLYFGVVYLSLGYVSLVFSFSRVPAGYRALPLLALAVGMLFIASAYHEALEFTLLHPLYLAGMLISLVAVIVAASSRIPMLIVLAAMATHYFWMHREGSRKLTAEKAGDRFINQTSFGFANGAAYLAVLLFLVDGFRPYPAVALAALAFCLNFLKVGFNRPRTALRRRNHYIYWAGVFWAIFVSVALHWLGREYPWASRAPFAVPFVLAAAILGLWTLQTYRDEALREDLGRSVLEASYLLVAVSYLLPYFTAEVSLVASLVQTILYTLLFLILYGVTQQRYLVHGATVVLLLFFSHLVHRFVADPAAQALIFTATGIVCMLAAVGRPPTAALRRQTLYVAWFVLSGLSIATALPHRAAMLAVSMVWGAAFLLGSLSVDRVAQAPAPEPSG